MGSAVRAKALDLDQFDHVDEIHDHHDDDGDSAFDVRLDCGDVANHYEHGHEHLASDVEHHRVVVDVDDTDVNDTDFDDDCEHSHVAVDILDHHEHFDDDISDHD